MAYLLIICITIIILFFGYLFYIQNNPYVDTIVKEVNNENREGRITGGWVRYKRTYKNGKIVYFEENY